MFGPEHFQFEDVRLVALMFLIPAMVVLYMYLFNRKKKSLARFARAETLGRISINVSPTKQKVKAGLIIAGIFLAVLSLMRPQGDPVEQEVKKRGRDVIFLLDISKSMLARDLKPNRLERAKIAINDVLDRMEGDRVGLVVFAGQAALKCPLTHDYNFFRTVLNRVSVRDVSRGGSLIGDAIRMAVDRMFKGIEGKYKDIIIITDGDDHDSFPVEAAEKAADAQVRVHTVGLGDPDGTRIPLTEDQNGFVTYRNEVVRSGLNAGLLREIASVTPGGVYIPVGTGTMDLGELYIEVIASAAGKEHESKRAKIWQEWYQFFLVFAVLLFIGEWFVGEQRSRNGTAPER